MNIRIKFLSSVGLLLAFISSCASADQAACETSNDALEAMPPVSVTITREDGSDLSFTAKLADNNYTRAAGFQRVCASTMKRTPILFVFENQAVPNFHMNNVVAAIDIAFVKKTSNIDTIYTMQPYSILLRNKPLYSPKKPVIAALETHRGFYAENNIDLQSRIHWKSLDVVD